MRKLLPVLILCLASLCFAGTTVLNQFTFPAQSTTGATDSIDFPRDVLADHTASLVVTGAPAGCTYRLEGSVDGTTWSDISGTKTCTSNTMFTVTAHPVTHIRGYLISLSGGTAPTVTMSYAGTPTTGAGGGGTVTHTGGALTSASLAAGNGGDDVEVLASDPTNCNSGSVPTGIDKTGAAKGCATAGVGTITGVTAGTGLSGGGTSGTVTVNMANTSTAVNGQTCSLGGSCTVADSTKVPTSTTVNGHALSSNVTVTNSDLGALPVAGGTMTGALSLGTTPLTTTYTNEGSTGTTTNLLAKLTTANPSTIVLAATSDVSGIIGICVSGCGTTSTSQIATRGQTSCVADASVTAGHYVTIGTNTAGRCGDSGAATFPSSGQVIGRWLANGTVGNPVNLHIFGPGDYGSPSGSTIVTYATPAAGITRSASGSQAIAGTELSGDATTSGSNAVSLAAPFKKHVCEIVIGGTGASNVLQTGDDAIAGGSCYNGIGVTETITGVFCLADTGTTTTVTPIIHGGGTILTGALTCGNNVWSSTGTLSGTPTITSAASVDGAITAVGTGHSVHIAIVYTVPAS